MSHDCAVLQANLHLVNHNWLLILTLLPHSVYTGFQSVLALVSIHQSWEAPCKAIKTICCIEMFYQSFQHQKPSRKHVVASPAELLQAEM